MSSRFAILGVAAIAIAVALLGASLAGRAARASDAGDHAASAGHGASGGHGASAAAHAAEAAAAPARHITAIGATVADLTPETSKKAGMASGVLVVGVDPDGPAALEAFLKGDVITEFEGVAVGSVDQLVAEVRRKQGGEMVRVRSSRKGSERMLALMTLGPPDPAPAAAAPVVTAPPSAAQPPSNAELVARVDKLEHQVETLRWRIDVLEQARATAH